MVYLLALAVMSAGIAQASAQGPALVGHRGLIHAAPENTLAGFGACLDLRIGFECDVRRTKDGTLVCLHDEDVKRTTGNPGKVAAYTFNDLRKLDAGAPFDPAFKGQWIPSLEETFKLIRERNVPQVPIAVDVKIDDATVAEEIVRRAETHGIASQLVCIGLTISDSRLRERFRKAHARIGVAVLAQTAEDLAAALADKHADWIYVRFLPTMAQVKLIHGQGKRVFLVGPLVAGLEPANWTQARAVGVDAVLTDYPLECRAVWKKTR